MSNLFQIQAAHQICFRISRLSSLGRLWAVKSWQSWKNGILLFDDFKYWNIGCNFLLNSNLFHLGHSCACLAVHLSCKEFSSNSDDCLLMRLEQQKMLIFSLKGCDLLIYIISIIYISIINCDKAILLLQLCYSRNVLHNLILSSTIITTISKYQSRLEDWCAPWCARRPQCWLPVENRLLFLVSVGFWS